MNWATNNRIWADKVAQNSEERYLKARQKYWDEIALCRNSHKPKAVEGFLRISNPPICPHCGAKKE